jgi:hypothetical protein
MNNINVANRLREETLTQFQGSIIHDNFPKNRHFSPNNQFYFKSETFSKPICDGVTFGSYFFVKIEIFENQSQTKIGEILTNYHETTHLWMSKSNTDYLFLAEFQFGISVFNLTTKTLNSFVSEDDWQQISGYYTSPDFDKLAIVKFSNSGYSLEVFDCSETMNLPYPILFKKHLTGANGHYIESINWQDNFLFDILTKEQIRLGKVMLKVEVIAILEEDSIVECRFKDIYDKQYTCFEKAQAMLTFIPDENTHLPINGFVDVDLVSRHTKNSQNLAFIIAQIDADYHASDKIEVLENQLETYWYYKNFIK